MYKQFSEKKKHEMQFRYVNLNHIIRFYIGPLILQLKAMITIWADNFQIPLLCFVDIILCVDVVILWWVLKVMCKVTSKLAYSKFFYINQSRVVFLFATVLYCQELHIIQLIFGTFWKYAYLHIVSKIPTKFLRNPVQRFKRSCAYK